MATHPKCGLYPVDSGLSIYSGFKSRRDKPTPYPLHVLYCAINSETTCHMPLLPTYPYIPPLSPTCLFLYLWVTIIFITQPRHPALDLVHFNPLGATPGLAVLLPGRAVLLLAVPNSEALWDRWRTVWEHQNRGMELASLTSGARGGCLGDGVS